MKCDISDIMEFFTYEDNGEKGATITE